MDADLELERAIAELQLNQIDVPPFADVLRRHRVTRLVAAVLALLGIGAAGTDYVTHRYPTESSVASAPVLVPDLTLADRDGIWPAADRPLTVEALADEFAQQVLGWRSFQTSFSPNSTTPGPKYVTLRRLDVSIQLLAAPSSDDRWTVLQIGDSVSLRQGETSDGKALLEPGTVPTRAVTAHWYAQSSDGSSAEGDATRLHQIALPFRVESVAATIVLFYDDLGQLVGAAGTSTPK